MKIKKILPALIMAASLALPACAPKDELKSYTYEATRMNQTYNIGEKEVKVKLKVEVTRPDKRFLIMTDMEENGREISGIYSLLTDSEGNPMMYSLELMMKDTDTKTTVEMDKDGVAEMVTFYDEKTGEHSYIDLSNANKSIVESIQEMVDNYELFAEVEATREKSKGWNVAKGIDYFVMDDLQKEDFEIGKFNRIHANKPTYSVSVYKKYGSDNVSYFYMNDDAHKESMLITDQDLDGNPDMVDFYDATFKKENGEYKYIKDLYTLEEVQEIFRKADEKLDKVNELTKDIKAKKMIDDSVYN